MGAGFRLRGNDEGRRGENGLRAPPISGARRPSAR